MSRSSGEKRIARTRDRDAASQESSHRTAPSTLAIGRMVTRDTADSFEDAWNAVAGDRSDIIVLNKTPRLVMASAEDLDTIRPFHGDRDPDREKHIETATNKMADRNRIPRRFINSDLDVLIRDPAEFIYVRHDGRLVASLGSVLLEQQVVTEVTGLRTILGLSQFEGGMGDPALDIEFGRLAEGGQMNYLRNINARRLGMLMPSSVTLGPLGPVESR